MTKALEHLEPKIVWRYFEDITQIPRPSKHEEQIREWLINFAKQHSITYQVDAVGNVRLEKPASPGMESLPMVCLQSHMDMVAERAPNAPVDPETEPLQLVVDEDKVTANQTTLGADNGIGIALSLALMTDPEVRHGPLEALITVDEETGLTGAFGLEAGFLKSDILLNIDSEDWGVVTIGCAGGGDTLVTFPATWTLQTDGVPLELSVGGLKGGHSGVDIHTHRQNAIHVLSRAVEALTNLDPTLRLGAVMGGSKRNAIPRDAHCLLLLQSKHLEKARAVLEELNKTLAKELPPEASVKLNLTEKEGSLAVIDPSDTKRFVDFLRVTPHGIYRWSPVVSNLVETSNNLGVIRTTESGYELVFNTRSSVNSQLDDHRARIEALARLGGCEVVQENAYPGWQPDPDAPLLEFVSNQYEKILGKKPVVEAIHAGLETALLGRHNPKMQMISLGPTIKNPHSPDEYVEIRTVDLMYELLKMILLELPADLVK